MTKNVSNKLVYYIFGMLLGLPFVAVATCLHAWLTAIPVTLQLLVHEQQTNELLWIIDFAPVVLCCAIGYIGRTKDFYESILNNIPADVVVFDKIHRYLYANPYAIKNPKYRRKIIGMDDYEYCAYRKRDRKYADERRNQFITAKNNEGGLTWEETMKAPDGNYVTHLRGLYPVKDKNGELLIMIGYAIDISDRKRLEDRKAKLIEQLRERNKKLNDFSSIIAHNVRAPLSNIASVIDLIDDTDDLEQLSMLHAYLRPSVESVSEVLNQLVDALHVMQDADIEYRNNTLHDCIELVVSTLAIEIESCGARLRRKFDADATLYGPPEYINSILLNLVSNALKYRSAEREPEITISAEDWGEVVLLSVADNGLGIDMKSHGDKLFKIGKVFHDNPGAKGFGLFMTKSQVESMNGKIWVESEPCKGSTFFVQLKKGR